MPSRKVTKRDITEEQFFKILNKAAQPLPDESDLTPIETSDILPDDDYTGDTVHHSKPCIKCLNNLDNNHACCPDYGIAEGTFLYLAVWLYSGLLRPGTAPV